MKYKALIFLLFAIIGILPMCGQKSCSASPQAVPSWCAGEEVPAADLRCGLPKGSFSSLPIPDAIFLRMKGKSFPSTCTVPRSDLRYLQLLHYDFKGKVLRGELICHKSIAKSLTKIFKELFKQKYPIQSIRLIDDFDADDESSMQANNTSCFCFRTVAGKKTLSKHARGLAIDVNPLINPCVRPGANGKTIVQPSTAGEYVNRKRQFAGKIDKQDLCYKIFTAEGFGWGGNWTSLKDYQHFEK